jgi:hypothetical protein
MQVVHGRISNRWLEEERSRLWLPMSLMGSAVLVDIADPPDPTDVRTLAARHALPRRRISALLLRFTGWPSQLAAQADAKLPSAAAFEAHVASEVTRKARGASETALPALADVQGGATHQGRLYRVDASHEGCSGLFYRSKPGVVSNAQGWPRNGAIVRGVEEVPGWLKLDNGFW